MFTGLIQRIGRLQGFETASGGRRLLVSVAEWPTPPVPGESIAVNGICLTVCGIKGEVLAFDVLQETFDRTTLGRKHKDSRLNLERALAAGEHMGGHVVTGHVDGTGTVVRRGPDGDDMLLRIACDGALANEMVLKGSIACDGVSLTITRLAGGSGPASAGARAFFDTRLVPFTMVNTALGDLKEGDGVNIETDVIGKYVRRSMSTMGSAERVTEERLRAAGFGE